MMNKRAKVYFIGAGPGDLELLTLKAIKIIKKADIVIYAGSLVDKSILRLARKNVSVYDSSRMNLDEICRVFKKAGEDNKIVARMHSGDPCLYGAIEEQMDFCNKENISCEVIPGVSSFQAAAASLKREFTSPGISQTVILSRISGRTKVAKKEDLGALSKHKATMVIFLSIQHIKDVVNKLRQAYPADTSVAVVEKASLPDERKILGKLGDIAKKVKQAGIKRQALIIVGDILKNNLQKKSKLYDKNFGHGFRKSSGGSRSEDSDSGN